MPHILHAISPRIGVSRCPATGCAADRIRRSLRGGPANVRRPDPGQAYLPSHFAWSNFATLLSTGLGRNIETRLEIAGKRPSWCCSWRSGFNLTFAIWILNAYFSPIPRELEEAALVDGTTRFGAMLRVVWAA